MTFNFMSASKKGSESVVFHVTRFTMKAASSTKFKEILLIITNYNILTKKYTTTV